MDKIRVKAYGLFNLTKKQYLVTQAIVYVILLTAFSLSQIFNFSSSNNIVLRYLGIGSVVIMVLEGLETWIMLKKFNQKSST